jgi:8-oxo-dGTP pyrophosphatase MutT (NUDIX family)
VEIIPIIKKIDKSLEIVLIANFRPPVGKFCLEFPAGMVEGSDYQEDALRELTEETGYIAEKILKVPEVLMNCDPWKSCEGGFLYIGIINEEDPNHKIKQNLE